MKGGSPKSPVSRSNYPLSRYRIRFFSVPVEMIGANFRFQFLFLPKFCYRLASPFMIIQPSLISGWPNLIAIQIHYSESRPRELLNALRDTITKDEETRWRNFNFNTLTEFLA